MASTRQAPPVDLFYDPPPPPMFDTAPPKPRPQLQPSAMPLQPMNNPIVQPDVVLEPPIIFMPPQSPTKSHAPPSPPRPTHPLNVIPPLPPPIYPQFPTDSPQKHLPPQLVRPYHPPPPQRPLFSTFTSNFAPLEQENYMLPMSRNENFAEFPEPSYARKDLLKRSFSDVTHSDRPFKKGRLEEDAIIEIPEPEEMPLVEDDGGKPSYSYAMMIGMAILRAPNRRLTLSQIYEWISATFAFFREDTKHSWHNSIRHNLSLRKDFSKVERPKGDAGKGSYWVIVPGNEHTFLKDRPRKSNNLANMTLNAHTMRPEPLPIAAPLAQALAPNPWLGQAKMPVPAPIIPALPELSSDATLPASDDNLNEDDVADFEINTLTQAPPSSPPQAMNSSPPAAAFTHRRIGSSPGRQQHPSSGLNRKRITTMDDSGYFSSLESSVLRSNKVVLTSEIDLIPIQKRKKHGRAEDEILRIRSSSHDVTPSHRRFRSLGSDDLLSSSPMRPTPPSGLNPMTPSFEFKKPARPPPSISPNTQLREYRRALQDCSTSPIKGLGEPVGYNQVFKSPGASLLNQFDDNFEIFTDVTDITNPTTPALLASSPLKFSVKRPSLTRASTTANVLSEITSGSVRYNAARTPSKGPILKPTPRSTWLSGGSPLKHSSTNPVMFEAANDLFVNFDMFVADENSDEGEGVDIVKGFQKIGGAANTSNNNPNAINILPATASLKDISPPKSTLLRPGLGARSLTSRF